MYQFLSIDFCNVIDGNVLHFHIAACSMHVILMETSGKLNIQSMFFKGKILNNNIKLSMLRKLVSFH